MPNSRNCSVFLWFGKARKWATSIPLLPDSSYIPDVSLCLETASSPTQSFVDVPDAQQWKSQSLWTSMRKQERLIFPRQQGDSFHRSDPIYPCSSVVFVPYCIQWNSSPCQTMARYNPPWIGRFLTTITLVLNNWPFLFDGRSSWIQSIGRVQLHLTSQMPQACRLAQLDLGMIQPIFNSHKLFGCNDNPPGYLDGLGRLCQIYFESLTVLLCMLLLSAPSLWPLKWKIHM